MTNFKNIERLGLKVYNGWTDAERDYVVRAADLEALLAKCKRVSSLGEHDDLWYARPSGPAPGIVWTHTALLLPPTPIERDSLEQLARDLAEYRASVAVSGGNTMSSLIERAKRLLGDI